MKANEFEEERKDFDCKNSLSMREAIGRRRGRWEMLWVHNISISNKWDRPLNAGIIY